MSKKLFGYLIAGIVALALIPGTAWGVCIVQPANSVLPTDNGTTAGQTAVIPTSVNSATANTIGAFTAPTMNAEGRAERTGDVFVYDDGNAPNCFTLGAVLSFSYNGRISYNAGNAGAPANANPDWLDAYDSFGSSGLQVTANSNTNTLGPGGAVQTVIQITVQQAGTAGGAATFGGAGTAGQNIVVNAKGSALRLKNIRLDVPASAGIAPNATVTVSSNPVANMTPVIVVLSGKLNTIASGSVTTSGIGTQSAAGGLSTQAAWTFTENFANSFRTAVTTPAVYRDAATVATTLVFDSGTSIPSGVTVTWPATLSTSATAATPIVWTLQSPSGTCTGNAAQCVAVYATTTHPSGAPAAQNFVTAATANGTPSTAVAPAVGVAIASPSGSGTATLHAFFGKGEAACSGEPALDVDGSAIPRYVTACTGTVGTGIHRNIFSSTNWFTINPVNTNLLFSYVTTASGFITGLTVANTAADAGAIPTAGNAATVGGAQTGGIVFYFFGQDPSNNNAPVVFSVDTDAAHPQGLGATACRGLDSNGRVPPGALAACAVVGGGSTTAGLLAAARNLNKTTATNFEGYVIAVTSFNWGHGSGVVFQGANAFAYQAGVMPNVRANAGAAAGSGERLEP